MITEEFKTEVKTQMEAHSAVWNERVEFFHNGQIEFIRANAELHAELNPPSMGIGITSTPFVVAIFSEHSAIPIHVIDHNHEKGVFEISSCDAVSLSAKDAAKVRDRFRELLNAEKKAKFEVYAITNELYSLYRKNSKLLESIIRQLDD